MIRAALFAAVAASTIGASAPEMSFIACPVYRDTNAGRKSGCWLSENPATGIRYDVTSSPTKPDWNHAILVEGRADAKAGDPCGGLVLDPVRVSVLDAPCPRFALQAEGYKGRRFALPARNVRPLYDKRKLPERPFEEGRFTIPFDYQSSFITYQLSDYYMDAALNYALDVQPAKIVIHGNAQTAARTISGTTLSELPSLAAERADVLRRAFILRGIAPDAISVVQTATPGPYEPAAFDGLVGPAARRVDVAIIPEKSTR